MCKLLTKVVEENLRTVADDCQRRVVAHRCHRFLSSRCHRNDGAVNVFLSEAEGDELAFVVRDRILNMPTALELLQLDTVCLEPFAIGVRLCQLFFYLAVIVNLAFLRVNKQYLTRLQATFADDVAWLEVHHSYFRSHYHNALLRNRIATGTKAVSVEHTACIASVAKE